MTVLAEAEDTIQGETITTTEVAVAAAAEEKIVKTAQEGLGPEGQAF